MRWIGGLTLPGERAEGVAVGNGHAYVVGDSGFRSVDISDPVTPLVVGVNPGAPGREIELLERAGLNVACVADYGLAIVDIGNPVTPSIIGQTWFGWVDGLAVSDLFAYAVSVGCVCFLHVIDLAVLTQPVQVNEIELLCMPYDVTVVGDCVYVAGGYCLTIFDATDPAAPFVAAHLEGMPATAFHLDGDFLYVAGVGLTVLDITDPLVPVTLGGGGSLEAVSIEVAGSHAYLTGDWPRVEVLDVSDPAAPHVVGGVCTPGRARDIAIAGGHAYVADLTPGLQVLAIDNPSSPPLIGGVDTPDNALDVAVRGDYAYVADGQSGLQVVDVSQPHAPAIVGSQDTPGVAYAVALTGSIACIADAEGGLRIVDVSTPTLPLEVGSVDTPGISLGLTVASPLVYLADGPAGLQIIDISNPQTPQTIGSCPIPGNAWDVELVDDLAYVAAYDGGVSVIDVSDPYTPTQSSHWPTNDRAIAVAAGPDRIYAADYGGGVHNGLTSIWTSDVAIDIEIAGEYAFVAVYNSGVTVLDISNSVLMLRVGSIDTPRLAQGIAVSGTCVYVADGDGGLQIVPIQCGATTGLPVHESSPRPVTTTLVATPNPMVSATRLEFSLQRAERVRCDIYDVSGRLVRRLLRDVVEPGLVVIRWDGRSDAGREVVSGAYYVRLIWSGGRMGHRITLLR